MSLKNKTSEHISAAVIYILLGVLFFKEIIFQIEWFTEDFFIQNFPFRFYAAVEISKLNFPLWNPYTFSGTPFFADIQMAVLYPFNLMLSFFVVDDRLSYVLFEYQVVFHFMIGGFFMYFFLRSLELDFYSALLGGILFVFNSFFINHAHHTNIIHSGIWLPAVFYCCKRGLYESPYWLLGCPVLLSVSFLGGHSQITLFICYAFAAFYFFNVYLLKDRLEIKQAVYRYGLIVLLFLLLSFVQILPAIEFLQNTNRNVLGYEGAVTDSLPIHSLLTLFMADLFISSYYPWQLWEFRSYASIGAIILAFLSLLMTARKTAFFWFLAFLSLILALGENTVVYKIFYSMLPGFQFFRVPARFIYLFIFALSVLAAYGFFIFTDKKALNSSAGNKKLLIVIGFISCLFLIGIPLLSVFTLDQPFTKYKSHLVNYLIISTALISLSFIILKFRKWRNLLRFIIFLIIVADLFYYRGLYNQRELSKNEMYNAIYRSPVAVVLKNEEKGTRFLLKNSRTLGIYVNMGVVYRMSNISGHNPFVLKNYALLNLNSPETFGLLGAKFIDSKDRNSLDIDFFINKNAIPLAFFVT